MDLIRNPEVVNSAKYLLFLFCPERFVYCHYLLYLIAVNKLILISEIYKPIFKLCSFNSFVSIFYLSFNKPVIYIYKVACLSVSDSRDEHPRIGDKYQPVNINYLYEIAMKLTLSKKRFSLLSLMVHCKK